MVLSRPVINFLKVSNVYVIAGAGTYSNSHRRLIPTSGWGTFRAR